MPFIVLDWTGLPEIQEAIAQMNNAVGAPDRPTGSGRNIVRRTFTGLFKLDLDDPRIVHALVFACREVCSFLGDFADEIFVPYAGLDDEQRKALRVAFLNAFCILTGECIELVWSEARKGRSSWQVVYHPQPIDLASLPWNRVRPRPLQLEVYGDWLMEHTKTWSEEQAGTFVDAQMATAAMLENCELKGYAHLVVAMCLMTLLRLQAEGNKLPFTAEQVDGLADITHCLLFALLPFGQQALAERDPVS